MGRSDVGGLVIDRAEFWQDISDDGLQGTIDGTTHHLDTSDGGGLFAFDGAHPTKTSHAAYADFIIDALSESLGLDADPVDIDAVAATDRHVLRALA